MNDVVGSIRVEMPKCHPGIFDGWEYRNAARGIENKLLTSAGLSTGLISLSVTSSTTLESGYERMSAVVAALTHGVTMSPLPVRNVSKRHKSLTLSLSMGKPICKLEMSKGLTGTIRVVHLFEGFPSLEGVRDASVTRLEALLTAMASSSTSPSSYLPPGRAVSLA